MCQLYVSLSKSILNYKFTLNKQSSKIKRKKKRKEKIYKKSDDYDGRLVAHHKWRTATHCKEKPSLTNLLGWWPIIVDGGSSGEAVVPHRVVGHPSIRRGLLPQSLAFYYYYYYYFQILLSYFIVYLILFRIVLSSETYIWCITCQSKPHVIDLVIGCNGSLINWMTDWQRDLFEIVIELKNLIIELGNPISKLKLQKKT